MIPQPSFTFLQLCPCPPTCASHNKPYEPHIASQLKTPQHISSPSCSHSGHYNSDDINTVQVPAASSWTSLRLCTLAGPRKWPQSVTPWTSTAPLIHPNTSQCFAVTYPPAPDLVWHGEGVPLKAHCHKTGGSCKQQARWFAIHSLCVAW